MWQMLKDLIATRGAQLIARYAANALIALATKYAITLDLSDATSFSKVIGAFSAAGICWLIDHWSHSKQNGEEQST